MRREKTVGVSYRRKPMLLCFLQPIQSAYRQLCTETGKLERGLVTLVFSLLTPCPSKQTLLGSRHQDQRANMGNGHLPSDWCLIQSYTRAVTERGKVVVVSCTQKLSSLSLM